jgi:hopanoid biosynthesis associated radical SAM protein HpnH
METTHDRITGRPGSFNRSMESLVKAKRKGFRVWTNTSVYKWTKPEELLELFSLLTRLGVDGILVSPAFGYESVAEDIFLKKEEAAEKFTWLDTFAQRFPLMGTPVYFDFIRGRQDMECTPWGNPTRNPLGWKSPCYLITDGYYESFSRLMQATRWDDYGPGKDARCANCMVHSGFEATVMRRSFSSVRTMLRMLRWNMH